MIGKADKEKQEFMTGYRPVVRAREGFMLAYVNRSMGPIGSIMAWHDRKG